MKIRAAFVVALVLLAGCTASQYKVLGGSGREHGKETACEYEGDTVRTTTPDMQADITYLPPHRLDCYFSLFKGGKYPNPIPPRSFVVFLLSLENKGDKKLTFNPRLSMLLSEEAEPALFKDYASFYADLNLIQAEDVDERGTAFREACFDTSVELAPGESKQGLLVFERLRDQGKSGRVLLNGLFSGTSPRTVSFMFKDGLKLDKEFLKDNK